MEFECCLNRTASNWISLSKLILALLILIIGLGQVDLVASQADEPTLTG